MLKSWLKSMHKNDKILDIFVTNFSIIFAVWKIKIHLIHHSSGIDFRQSFIYLMLGRHYTLQINWIHPETNVENPFLA